MKIFSTLFVYFIFLLPVNAQIYPIIEQFLSVSYLRGASVSIMIKDVNSDSILYSHDAEREVIPASVMKTITTATALEVLGEDFRYETDIMYDGSITDSILNGNLYIRGSGDPSTGSSELGAERNKMIDEWIDAIKKAGVRVITGSVIADESIFDTEGISMKWMREDIGSYYGQGCYGLNIFDNNYTLFLSTEESGSKPKIVKYDPEIPTIFFRNYLTVNNTNKDSTYIIGFPYSNERYLYGTIPANRSAHKLKGDIPDPALFTAQYFTKLLKNENITVNGAPTCYRILSQEGKWDIHDRKILITTYSLPLKDLVHITNHVSNNLFADAFLKTIGLSYISDEVLSSFDKGIKVLNKFWEEKGFNTSSLWMFDGSGLAATDKTTAGFLCELLSYMSTKSLNSKAFIESIPRAGIDGTVANILKGSRLQGKTRLKSGSMSRVRSYAGYVNIENKQFAVSIIVNNFSCNQSLMKAHIEHLLLSLF